ncbi:MAG: (Fe-S)-binding protein [Rhodospirillales bacterium]|nr:(Fe-S)-binding protein [Rhodospirillales bacterium]MBO6788430.1 (Fe-S)-binding protein [Rhodospirillales bacterium]
MQATVESFISDLDRRIDGIVDVCTMCGKCADVCPTPAAAGIDGTSPETLTKGVIDILKGDVHDPDAETWARKCCGTARCIDACPEGINPRFMLAMARRRLNEQGTMDVRRGTGRDLFQDMSKGVRMLSRLQLPVDVLARLNPPAKRSVPDTAPDLVFYTGCNLLKTPHIGLMCLDILDKLGATYEVYGGPGNCCGVLQFRPGDTENAGRQALTTIQRFHETGASEVLAWCPTCQIQFGEIVLPSVTPPGETLFDINMFPVYMARRLDDMKRVMTAPVNKKVALFEFPGARGVTEAVQSLLSAIPGIELVDLGLERAGYQMSSLVTLPDYQKTAIADVLRAAEAAGVTTLCSVFHADHREISSHEAAWPFEIVNYMDLIGESAGVRRDDLFKRLKAMQDVDAIVTESADTIAEHGMTLEQARDAVAAMLAEQILPVERDRHPDAAD